MEAKTFPLTRDYTPILNIDLLYREGEYKVFQELLLREWSGANIWVEGKKGMGKTTVIKYLIAEANTTSNYFAKYLKIDESPNRMQKRLAQEYGISWYSYYPSLLAQKIMEEAQGKKIILVFDETENLYPTDNSRKKYNPTSIRAFDGWITSMWNYWVEDKNQPVSYALIGTVSPYQQSKYFRPTALSRYQWKWEIFKRYTAEQIENILRIRLDKCTTLDGNPIPYDEASLQTLASITYDRWESDLRQAFDTLMEAIKCCKQSLDMESMNFAIELHKREWWRERLYELGWDAGLLLYTIAVKGKLQTVRIKDKYKAKTREAQRDPLSRRQVNRILSKFAPTFYDSWKVNSKTRDTSGQLRTITEEWVEMTDEDDRRRIVEAGTDIYGTL